MGKLETTQLGNVNVEEMDFTRKPQNGSWVVMESTTIENSSSSINSIESSSSSHLMEDASSSTHQNGPLFELSDLMIHLPLRRIGLSKHYQGKSQSFTSLTSVKNVDHLAKKMSCYQINKMMKPSKSYAGGLNVQESRISKKKSSRGSFLSFTRSSRPSTNNTYVRN